MVTGHAGHNGRNALIAVCYHFFDIRDTRREGFVGMAQQQGIQPLHLGKIDGGVLHQRLLQGAGDTGVRHL